MEWKEVKVLVTGGASFIGSHLVDALVARGAAVTVVDDLSSGRLENIKEHLDKGKISFLADDLLGGVAARAMTGVKVVFHLAAKHGGRGYVDHRQAECSSNLALDGIIFKAALETGVEKVVYASSGCVYPNFIQADPKEELYLSEAMVGPPYDADNMYGWAKLMGEFTLKAYYAQCGLKSVSCRYFAVYGPRALESHSVIAMIARAFLREDPFRVWGTGEQVRNWTYVDDIVEGTILAAGKINDGSAVNLGTTERISVLNAAREVLGQTGHKAEIMTQPDMPTGPMNRVADNRLGKQLLGWEPKVAFREGLRRTIDWYFRCKDARQVRVDLNRMAD